MSYEYATGDRLEDRNTYFYSAYGGRSFLDEWGASRDRAIERMGPLTADPPASSGGRPPSVAGFSTADLLELLFGALEPEKNPSDDDLAWLDLLVQRFEVTKRLHRSYGPTRRATDRAQYRDYELYVRFAEVLETAYWQTESLVYLSALLKTMDTLCSLVNRLPAELAPRLVRLVLVERRIIERKAEHLGVTW